MSIEMNSLCVSCLMDRHINDVHHLRDEQTATQFSLALMELVGDFIRKGGNSAGIGPYINELYARFYGLPEDRYREEKQISNDYVLQRLPLIRQKVTSASDPVFAGIQHAILGNYLDFSALGKSVSFDQLDQMLEKARDYDLDKTAYAEFCQDLKKAKNLLYVTDNAGELGFDMVLAEVLQKNYPELTITFCVRGGPAHNDATREDAEAINLPFPVIDSGCAIGGMELSLLGEDARKALDEADVIIAKGMGNTESMFGCGKNVYYAFLVKCARFRQFFGKPQMTPMFVHEPQT